jgi:1-acyl-sn-glycerol-3-phosphate acyltransferase
MKFIHKVPLFLFNIFYPYKIHGKENIPKGSAVFVCNHFRAIDCGFVADAYNSDVYFLAKNELFKNKLFGKIVKSFGAIPVDRDNPDIKSMMAALKVLKEGHKLVVFPEGTRNKTGTTELQEIKGGSMIFAVKAKCPIVPMMLNGKAKPFRKTHLIIGEPFELSDFYGKKLNNDDMEEMAKIVTNKMLEQQNKLNEILNKKKRTKKK